MHEDEGGAVAFVEKVGKLDVPDILGQNPGHSFSGHTGSFFMELSEKSKNPITWFPADRLDGMPHVPLTSRERRQNNQGLSIPLQHG
jgi:hypothetical protein